MNDTITTELARLIELGKEHGIGVKEFNGKRVITITQSVEQMKNEVLEILRDGVSTSRGFERPTPEDITEFGDLHDLCDANCLGYLCDEDVLFVDEQGPIHDHNGSDENNDRWIEFGNKVQQQVHEWIEAKGHHPVHVRTAGCNPVTCSIDHALAFDASLPDLHVVAGDTNSEPIKQSLVVAFDVTGWTDQQINSLLAAVSAQGEEVFDQFFSSPDEDQSHPDVESIDSEIIEHDGDLDLTGVLHVGLGH